MLQNAKSLVSSMAYLSIFLDLPGPSKQEGLKSALSGAKG